MRSLHFIFRSPLSLAAALSVLLVCGSLAWRTYDTFQSRKAESMYVASASEAGERWREADPIEEQELALLGLATDSEYPDAFATSSTDQIAMIGPMVVGQVIGEYVGLSERGVYSASAGEAATAQIAEHVRAVVPHKTYKISDFKTDPDISYDRMLAYRSDLRIALQPLLENDGSELEIYGKYVETSDPAHLEKLREAAERYRAAAEAAAAMTVPRDAVNYHKDILNAMEQFAATLDAMAKYADDPFASVALLRSYNAAEARMFTTFDALGNYYGQKIS